MVVYTDNNKRDAYKLYITDTKRVVICRDVKWADWKITDPTETLKMSRKAHKEYFVPVIEEVIITYSEPEDKMHVHVIPDEG